MEADIEKSQTPLMVACRSGNYNEVKRLIDLGHEINESNKNGTTPLMYAKTSAFGSGSLSILNLLIQNGANVNQKDNNGKSALDYAVTNSEKLISFLKENSQ